jgi:hypothetical protein
VRGALSATRSDEWAQFTALLPPIRGSDHQILVQTTVAIGGQGTLFPHSVPWAFKIQHVSVLGARRTGGEEGAVCVYGALWCSGCGTWGGGLHLSCGSGDEAAVVGG